MSSKTVSTQSKVKLGKTGPEVFPIGLGCMGFSGTYGPTEDKESIATIQHAIDRGVTLLDTGDFYGMGHNELLIRRALEETRGQRDRIQLSVKFGAMRGPDNSWGGVDTRPAAVKNFIAYSLKRLGVDFIDIYRPARLDPSVPIEETIGAIAELVKAGYVKHIGLSEVSAETVRRAQAVHPIVDLQIEYALVTRGPERTIFPALRELGISATLYGVLSRGLLSGSKPTQPGDYRAFLPRFSKTAEAGNERVVNAISDFAKARDMSPAQLAIAYVRAKQPGFLPIIGAKTRAQVDDALLALTHDLSKDDVREIERVVPENAIEGGRYAAEQMKHLDSERI
jgi:aryl-alcohol dehydrogenase-like predicted oxidoreductase